MNIVEMCELYSTLYLKSILPLYCGCKSLSFGLRKLIFARSCSQFCYMLLQLYTMYS